MLLIGLPLILISLFLTSLSMGRVEIPFLSVLFQIVPFSNDNSAHDLFFNTLIFDVRMPRVLLSMINGALLSLSGVLIQGLFRNPLAEPSLLGVSSGATLGMAISIVLYPWLSSLGFTLSQSVITPIFAFCLGLFVALIIYRLSMINGSTSTIRLLLCGVAITAFLSSSISFLSYISDSHTLKRISLWAMGSMQNASWSAISLNSLILLMITLYAWRISKVLDAFQLGENEAKYIGVAVKKYKLILLSLAALGTAMAVITNGIIGFIALVVPHICRLFVGSYHRYLIPLSVLLGAMLLSASDLLAKSVLPHGELPVGIITTFIGAPFFLYLLIKNTK
ncbi:iron ABC transporter permease [Vibrio sp.]|nr:iron ABC transporter permease [Vibrio sp.]